MERTLDFNNVTSYDFDLAGPDMTLRLFQGDTITSIKIEVTKDTARITNRATRAPKKLSSDAGSTVLKKASLGATRRPSSHLLAPEKESKTVGVKVTKKIQHSRMTEDKVKEIRAKWDQAVEECKTKTAAAERFAKIYNCSAKNIYAIIYRYSWAGI